MTIDEELFKISAYEVSVYSEEGTSSVITPNNTKHLIRNSYNECKYKRNNCKKYY